ncbi:MAG: AsmA-like C-terminal domain-containing protein [Desulfobacterium sp.]|nr:AsmA-like C-terminal domain-containing protein [Desulfobacterium sp.]
MTAKKKYPVRVLVLTLFLVSIFILGICFSFLWLRDSSYLRDELSTFLAQKLNIPLTSEKIELRFFPFPSLTITDLKLDTDRDVHILINKVLIVPDLLSLATGKLDINRIRLKTISVTPQTRPENNDAPLQIDLKDLGLPLLSELFSMLPTSQNDLVVTFEDFHHHPFDRMEGSIIISPERKKISGNILVQDLKIDEGSPLNLIPEKTVSAFTTPLVTTDFSLTDTSGLEMTLTMVSPEIYLKGDDVQRISGKKIEISASVTTSRIELSITPFTLDSPDLTLAVDFRLDHVTESAILAFKGENIQIGPARSAALGLLKQNKICEKLFWILRNGFVPEINVSFSSNTLNTLFDPEKMVIVGSVSKGVVKIPETKLTVTDIQAGVTMENGILHTRPTKARVVGGAIKKGALWVDILGHKNDFNGEFDLTADLDALSHTLKLLLPNTLLARELHRCSRIGGSADGTLELKSTGGDLSVSVQAEKIVLSGEYDRIPGTINLTARSFTFDKEKIHLDGLGGTSALGNFSNVNAGITLDDDPLLTLATGAGKLDVSALFTWLSRFKPIQPTLLPLMPARGTINLDQVRLKGAILTPLTLDYSIDGSFTDLTLADHSPTHGESSGISNASGRFMLSPKNKRLTQLKGTMHTSDPISFLTGAPQIEELLLPLTLSQGFMEADGTGVSFKGELKFKTETTLFISLRKTPDAVSLDQATIKVKDREIARITNRRGDLTFEGILDTRTLDEILKPGGPALNLVNNLTQNGHFTISTDWDNTPVLTMNFLDLNLILKNKTQGPQDSLLPKGFNLPPFILKADSLKYNGSILKQVKARIIPTEKAMEITILNASFCEIDFTGTIKDNHNILGVHFTTYTEDKDLNTTLSCLYGKQELIEGRYSLKANLDSTGNMATLTDNLKGEFTVDSPGGRIYKLTLLSRIVSVINIAPLFKGKLPDLEQNGFAYKSLTVNAQVNQGKIIFKDSVIDGQDMSIVFNGWVDPTLDTLELIFLVAPFKTVDLLVQRIPILGTILKGTLVSIPVKASGAVNNPNVFLLPPAEVGKGLMGTMQRILETPFRLIDKLPGN